MTAGIFGGVLFADAKLGALCQSILVCVAVSSATLMSTFLTARRLPIVWNVIVIVVGGGEFMSRRNTVLFVDIKHIQDRYEQHVMETYLGDSIGGATKGSGEEEERGMLGGLERGDWL